MTNQMQKFNREQLIGMINNGTNKVALDLGCGARKKTGHVGLDIAPLEGVDIVCNIEEGFPIENDIVDSIYSNFMFEHIPNTIFLFQELYRISKKDSVIEFKVPYYQSNTQYKDPTHSAIILPETMRYFSDDKWYGSDYSINVNFEILNIEYEYLPPFNYWQLKRYILFRPILYPIRKFARRFLWNVVHSIVIKVKVVK